MPEVKSQIFSNDEPVPCHIELSEWSGPVSPRYQYELDVTLTAGDGDIIITHREDAGSDEVGKTREIEGQISREIYEAFMAELLALEPFSLPPLERTERAARDGGSESHLSLRLGDRQKRFVYSPALLARGEHPEHQRLVSLIKGLVERLPET